jgi:C-terminal processing protease CtpA/Prc
LSSLLSGGAADKNGTLKVGDEILSVNNVDVTRMTRLEAWNFMKKLNDGNQVVTVRQKLLNVPLVKTELVGSDASRAEKTH